MFNSRDGERRMEGELLCFYLTEEQLLRGGGSEEGRGDNVGEGDKCTGAQPRRPDPNL